MKEHKRFEIVECQGTSYEVGKQYGTACRLNIVKSIDDFIGGIKGIQKASREDILSNARKYYHYMEQFDPEGMEFLKGQAEGSGVTFEEVLALKCRFELGIYYRYITCLCTSFAATGEATSQGRTIIGQNFDLTVGMTIDLLRIRPKNGPDQLTLIFGGGCELTLNSAGLGMALNVMMSPASEQALCVPCCSIITKAMRQKRIGDALGIVCASGRSVLNYLFASAEGDIVGVETRPGDFNVYQADKDMLVHSNHYLTDRFKRGDGTFGLMEGDSYIRIHRIQRLMEKHYGELNTDLMMEILSDHHNYPNSICAHFNHEMPRGETLSSVIMDPAEGVMYIAFGQPCQHEFEAYRI
jgi:isopenicillin-N N-acyltransferase-like protein